MDNFQLVVFRLGQEEYAVNISFAHEIIRIPALTKMPNTPPFLEGVFNLRGKVIPVIDLKKRFELPYSERDVDSRLLILELDGMKAGIIVDDVSEVMHVNKTSIENLEDEIVGISENSIEGICLVEDRIIILLNASKLKEEIFKVYIERKKAV